MGLVTKSGEDHHAGYQTGHEVYDRDNMGVNVHPGMELVVASKHNDTAPGNTEGEEHLMN